jgi:hypothetical protein
MRDMADLEFANDFAAFQRNVAQSQRLMRTVDRTRLQRRMPPAWLARSHLL